MLEVLSNDTLNSPFNLNGNTSFQSSRLMLSICIHVTGSKEDVEEYIPATETPWTQSAPLNVPISIQYGKPCFRKLLENEKAEQVGALAVSVCGPGGLGDSVREAVRSVQGEKTVDLFEETFSW